MELDYTRDKDVNTCLNDFLVPAHLVGVRDRLRSANHGDMIVLHTSTSRYTNHADSAHQHHLCGTIFHIN